MIREALSQLMNNAENKNISSLLQEAIEEMKKMKSNYSIKEILTIIC